MNVRFDDQTRRLLDQIAPLLDRPADWDDVLTRADASASPRAERVRRWRITRPLALAAAAAVAALVAGVLLTRGGSPSLTDRALAAISGGPMTHVIVEQGLTDRLVDLRTGSRTPAPLRIEFWSEPRHGIVYERTSLGQTQTIFLPVSQQPTSALTAFYLDYRAKLRNGEVRERGRGRIDGQPVYWLELPGDTAGATVRVAVSQQTFKPVYTELWQDGRHVLADDTRILTVESLPLDAALFRRAPTKQSPMIGTIPSYPRITLAQAASQMKRAPVVPGVRIAGLHRVWIGPPRWQVGSSMQNLSPPAGVRLFYGATEEYASSNDFGSRPNLNAAHVDITEYAHYNPVLARPYGGAGSFPTGGKALLRHDVDGGGGDLLTLGYRGLWITVEASSPRLAVAAGQALVHTG